MTNWGPSLTIIRRLGYAEGAAGAAGSVLVRVDFKHGVQGANVYVGERPSPARGDELDGFGDRRLADPPEWIPVGIVQWEYTWGGGSSADMPEVAPAGDDQWGVIAALVAGTAPGWRPRLDNLAAATS